MYGEVNLTQSLSSLSISPKSELKPVISPTLLFLEVEAATTEVVVDGTAAVSGCVKDPGNFEIVDIIVVVGADICEETEADEAKLIIDGRDDSVEKVEVAIS